jgi:hypothetical protein
MGTLFDLEMNGVDVQKFDLMPKDSLIQREEKDKTGYAIGQDWAFYHQPLPDGADAAIYRGHQDSKARSRGREIDRYTKKWLQLRYHAYFRERTVSDSVTPDLLRVLDLKFCRITQVDLTHGTQLDSDWSVERLCNDAGYAWGNLTIISRKANESRGSMSFDDIIKASQSTRVTNGLKQIEWMRYKNIVRGPYFWAGKVKGIEPICMTMPRMVFIAPSQLLQDLAFWTVCHKNHQQRDIQKKILKRFCPTGASDMKLRKLLIRIDRNFQKGHGIHATFTNPSCMNSFLEWYESTNFSTATYIEFFNKAIKGFLHLPKNSPTNPNPIEEWWLTTGGHTY